MGLQLHRFISYFALLWLSCGVEEFAMNTLLTIAIIIVILWAVGFFALPGVGALIHLLLVIAVILVVIWMLTGKKLWK
jgi:hypothetical protein